MHYIEEHFEQEPNYGRFPFDVGNVERKNLHTHTHTQCSDSFISCDAFPEPDDPNQVIFSMNIL